MIKHATSVYNDNIQATSTRKTVLLQILTHKFKSILTRNFKSALNENQILKRLNNLNSTSQIGVLYTSSISHK